jgi:hypothetical protein
LPDTFGLQSFLCQFDTICRGGAPPHLPSGLPRPTPMVALCLG